jgi:hypothetical protein
MHVKEKTMNTDLIESVELVELVDLGDAAEETRQYLPIPAFPDSVYFWGLVPDLG